MPPTLRRLLVTTATLAIALTAIGCGCSRGERIAPLEVTITRSPNLSGELVPIALYAVSDATAAEWVGRGAQPAATLTREGGSGRFSERAVKRIYLTVDGADSKTLTRDDPVWRRWGDARGRRLVAVANVGARNPNDRAAISIDACDWRDGPRTLQLAVDESGLRIYSRGGREVAGR